MAPLVVEEQIHRPAQNLSRGLSRSERLQQLERIVSSSHFRNSKRYPSFLRYVVERTVEEDSEVLKERNLGVEVFGRPSDYDTNSDPIVRVTAGEVRKRLAQYYQTPGHEHELRIELPLGSYVPTFYTSLQPAPTSEIAGTPAEGTVESSDGSAEIVASHISDAVGDLETPASGRSVRLRTLFFYLPAAVLALIGIVLTLFAVRPQTSNTGKGISYFWQSTLAASTPALIVIGVHSIDANGKNLPTDSYSSPAHTIPLTSFSSMVRYDMAPVSDIVSYSRMTDLLGTRTHTYRTIASTDATLQELRHTPVILIGGFDNIWTMRLTQTLRFRPLSKSVWVNGIVDSKDPSNFWAFDDSQPARGSSRDYAIVASYFDPTLEQHVIIAAGIGNNGTLAATEFLTSEKYLSAWLKDASIPANKNLELVLSTDIIDGESGPPHVVAYSAW